MDQEKIGNFIKKIREENKLTQAEFASKLGVTYQAVSKWENAKNMPDIAILKKISELFDVDIQELLNGEKNMKKREKTFFYITIGMFLFVIFFLLYYFFLKSNFEFRSLSSSCTEFTISGSAAYTKDKSSIYISDIQYCGKKEDPFYKKIDCILYEENGNIETKISSCSSMENKTLNSFLKDVQITVKDYKPNCGNFAHSKLYLQINAISQDEQTITYKIPITLAEICSFR